MYFHFSNCPFPDPSPKCQNILDLPKLEVIVAFWASPSLWLVPIFLCTPISSLGIISKDEQYLVNYKKSVTDKLRSTRTKGEMSKSWGRKTRGGTLTIKEDSQEGFFKVKTSYKKKYGQKWVFVHEGLSVFQK